MRRFTRTGSNTVQDSVRSPDRAVPVLVASILALALMLATLLAEASTSVPASIVAPTSTPRSYAVFMVQWNSKTHEARGGVAGTAFFISGRRALTAYHVLQPKSFTKLPGFDRSRIWLVNESAPPIEIKSDWLHYFSKQDVTRIELPADVAAVPASHVFALRQSDPTGRPVESEGYLVNTAGPQLEFVGDELRIISVPRLERLAKTGTLLRSARVDLNASDVQLNSTPCVELSYEPIRGMSGGPVLADGAVVGVNSFGDPQTKGRTWAVAIAPEFL